MKEFGPSDRALANVGQAPAWALMQHASQKPQYDQEVRPDGLVNLSGALNNLMNDWWDRYLDENPIVIPAEQYLPYGSISGTPDLHQAVAGFFNHFFSPSTLLTADNILTTNGITSLIDLISWTLCDTGDAILYPTPTFYMLDFDLGARNDILKVPVSCSSFLDRFSESAAPKLLSLLEETVAIQSAKGVRCKMLFICNPANPQGRCYSLATLTQLARFCRKHGIHLVADEVYSMSQYSSDHSPLDAFSSVLSIPEEAPGSLSHVHCLYSLSKDFNMGGLRLGFLATRNSQIRATMDTVTWFTWISAFSVQFMTRFIQDLNSISEYLSVYSKRLGRAYKETTEALVRCGIPFQLSNAGLFIYIDLSQWVDYFSENSEESKELCLCRYLIDHGVFLNPGEASHELQLCGTGFTHSKLTFGSGQFAGSDQPGCFRFVFTEMPSANLLAVQRIRDALDDIQTTPAKALQDRCSSLDSEVTLRNRNENRGDDRVNSKKRLLKHVSERWKILGACSCFKSE